MSPSRSPPPAVSAATSQSAAIDTAARSSARLVTTDPSPRTASHARRAVGAVDRAHDRHAGPDRPRSRERPTRPSHRLSGGGRVLRGAVERLLQRHVATIGGVPTVDAKELFAPLGQSYDRVGATLSLGQDPRWRRFLVSAAAARRRTRARRRDGHRPRRRRAPATRVRGNRGRPERGDARSRERALRPSRRARRGVGRGAPVPGRAPSTT